MGNGGAVFHILQCCESRECLSVAVECIGTRTLQL